MSLIHKFLKSVLSPQASSIPIAAKASRNTVYARVSILFSKPKRLKSHFKPATLAMLVQAMALLLVFAISYCVQAVGLRYFDAAISMSLLHLVVAQSIIAMLLSVLIGMDNWWRWIHAGFPLAGWAMAQWHIPNELYLAAFLISLSLYWTTFRTQVPFFTSRPIAWQHVVRLMPTDRPVHLIDIGSGIGDMVMHAAQHGMKISDKSSFTGIEIAILPWLISYVRASIKRSNAVFRLGDYHQLAFAQYDIVFAYLSPAAMTALWEKASREMRPGSMLISYEFEIPGIAPDVFIPGTNGSPTLYAWNMPAGNR